MGHLSSRICKLYDECCCHGNSEFDIFAYYPLTWATFVYSTIHHIYLQEIIHRLAESRVHLPDTFGSYKLFEWGIEPPPKRYIGSLHSCILINTLHILICLFFFTPSLFLVTVVSSAWILTGEIPLSNGSILGSVGFDNFASSHDLLEQIGGRLFHKPLKYFHLYVYDITPDVPKNSTPRFIYVSFFPFCLFKKVCFLSIFSKFLISTFQFTSLYEMTCVFMTSRPV